MTAVVDPLLTVLADIATERRRQDANWGEQNHPDGTDDGAFFRERARRRRQSCQAHADQGTVTWRHILDEEVHEAYTETDPAKLRAELVQVAAVAAAWIEAIDRRSNRAVSGSLSRAQASEPGRPVDLWLGPSRRDTVRLADIDLHDQGQA